MGAWTLGSVPACCPEHTIILSIIDNGFNHILEYRTVTEMLPVSTGGSLDTASNTDFFFTSSDSL